MALSKLRLAERTQARRRYYTPRRRRILRRTLSMGMRTKVSVGRAQLLQRLVLLESNTVDRGQDAQVPLGSLPHDDLVLRFVKQLVWNATRRNSLHVSVAIGRVLHNYTTAMVLDLFATVTQDPDSAPDDSYVRWVKRNLFRELKARFGGLLRTRRGPHGEETFESTEPSPRILELVRSCLELLTPWDTSCPVPVHFDALSASLRHLHFVGTDPDHEHPIEVNRMHALIHPDCFQRLTEGLGLPVPPDRLSVPALSSSGDPRGDGDANANRVRPPALEKRDIEDLQEQWVRQDEVRQRSKVTDFTIQVDGVECARVELAQGASAHFDLEEASELLECGAVAGHEEIPLAVHRLGLGTLAGVGCGAEVVVDLDCGWELALNLRPEPGLGQEAGRIRVDARWRLKSLGARARHGWRSWTGWWAHRRWLGRGLPVAAALLLVLSFVISERLTRVAEVSRTPSPTADTGADTTRGVQQGSAIAVTLGTARRIFIGPVTGPEAEMVTGLLSRAAEMRERFEVVNSAEDAEVALKVRSESRAIDTPWEDPGTCRVELELVDAEGRSLWSAWEIAPDWETAVLRSVANLVRAVDRARGDGG